MTSPASVASSVGDILKDITLYDQYHALLVEENGFEHLQDFDGITVAQLQELGMKLGHANRLMREVESRLVGSSAPAANITAPVHQPTPVMTTSPPQQTTGAYSTHPAVSRVVNTEHFVVSASGSNNAAISKLRAIVGNILNDPRDPKYRKLRLLNPTLAEHVFSNSGSVPFLVSLGFRRQVDERLLEAAGRDRSVLMPGQNIFDAEQYDDDVCVMLLPAEEVDVELLKAALQALEEVDRRDAEEASHMQQYTKFRSSMGLAIRRERLQEAVANDVKWNSENQAQLSGSLSSGQGSSQPLAQSPLYLFLLKEFERNNAADALESLAVLRQVFSNIAAHPGERKYRELRVGNSMVHRYVLSVFGSMELITSIGGFQLVDNGLHFRGDGSVEARTPELMNARDGGCATEDDEAARYCERALAYINSIRETIQAAASSQATSNGKDADDDFMAQLREARKAEPRLSAKNHGTAPSEGGAPASAATTGGSARRVPIAEALKQLLGTE